MAVLLHSLESGVAAIFNVHCTIMEVGVTHPTFNLFLLLFRRGARAVDSAQSLCSVVRACLPAGRL